MSVFAKLVESGDTYLAAAAKGQAKLGLDDKFGVRLREERRRLNLNQTEFAALGGVTLGSQTRYETGDQVPKTDYIHGIALHGVDVLYVLTGRRDAEAGLSEAASELLTIFHSLPQNMQRASLAILQALRDESETDRTLHQPKTNFHAE